jgi:hypothetical protein
MAGVFTNLLSISLDKRAIAPDYLGWIGGVWHRNFEVCLIRSRLRLSLLLIFPKLLYSIQV